MIETVIAAAHRFAGVVFSLPQPARHSHILRALHQLNETAAIEGEQGFLSNIGRFLTREEAKRLVEATGQATIGYHHETQLFSEDLW